jgi:hypothetical protein
VQPYVHGNADLVLIIVTVFAVFAGFLVAVITIVGDPALIPEGSWRVAELQLENIDKRLVTHVWLFMLYLITIALLFACVVLHKAIPDHDALKTWIERLCIFFSVFAFLLTFGLPIALIKTQRGRVRAEIERRRLRDGIPADTSQAAS